MLRTKALAAVLLGGSSGTFGELVVTGSHVISNGNNNDNDSRTPVTVVQMQEFMNQQPAWVRVTSSRGNGNVQ
jgi:hypothetical protein